MESALHRLSFRAKSRNLSLLTVIPQQRETPLDMTERWYDLDLT
jgi:hypothetical protein